MYYSEYGNLSVSDPKVASSQVKINENFVKIIFSKLKLKLFLNSNEINMSRAKKV